MGGPGEQAAPILLAVGSAVRLRRLRRASHNAVAARARYPRLVGEPAVGDWLTEHYWAPGNAMEWTDRIERATGQPLSAQVLVRDLLA